MNGDMPHDGGHGGGGHAVGEELQKTGRYEALAALNTPGWTCPILPKDKSCIPKKSRLHDLCVVHVLYFV